MIFKLKTKDIDNRNIYITGNFNNWNPRDKDYILKKINDSESLVSDKNNFKVGFPY